MYDRLNDDDIFQGTDWSVGFSVSLSVILNTTCSGAEGCTTKLSLQEPTRPEVRDGEHHDDGSELSVITQAFCFL